MLTRARERTRVGAHAEEASTRSLQICGFVEISCLHDVRIRNALFVLIAVWSILITFRQEQIRC